MMMMCGPGCVVKIFFILESDSFEVQTLLAAVDSHHLPQVGLPLYLEAKGETILQSGKRYSALS